MASTKGRRTAIAGGASSRWHPGKVVGKVKPAERLELTVRVRPRPPGASARELAEREPRRWVRGYPSNGLT
jgi:hypothetical protein